MKARNFVLTLLALCVWGAAANAQGVWEKKDWKQWSKNDCQKILEDSPWAQKWENNVPVQTQFGRPTGGTGRETEQSVYYIIQLRSALPIRQAFIRKAQFENNYDKLGADQKKQFDDSAERFLARKYEDVILVHVIYGSNISMYAKEMKRIWQGYPEDAPPTDTSLVLSNGVRLKPLKIISAPGGGMEFELVFPRQVQGEPVVTPDTKFLGVEFPHPDLSKINVETTISLGKAVQDSTTDRATGPARVYKAFKTEKMIVNGVIVY